MMTEEEYLKECEEEHLKKYPPVNYKDQRVARKFYVCNSCEATIPPGDIYWYYKPNPTYNKFTKKKTYHKWSRRCIDCEPRYHEGDIYEK